MALAYEMPYIMDCLLTNAALGGSSGPSLSPGGGGGGFRQRSGVLKGKKSGKS